MSKPLISAYVPAVEPDQRVFTPQKLIDRLILPLWPEGIAYDPYPGFGSPVTELADRFCTGDGFLEPLEHRTYGNPPFARLKEAMEQFRVHAEWPGPKNCSSLDEYLLLGPAQTHRSWFWECLGDAVAWLRALAFEGHSNTFPKPLVLHYYGTRINAFIDVANASGLAVHVE